MNLALCQAVWNGQLHAIRSAGELFPFDQYSIWLMDYSYRVVHLKRHCYPMTREHMQIVGDRVVVEEERDERVIYGQRTMASGWPACVEWLAKYAVRSTIASPLLREAVEVYATKHHLQEPCAA